MNKKKYFDFERLSLSLKRTIKMMFPPVSQHSPNRVTTTTQSAEGKKKKKKTTTQCWSADHFFVPVA